MAQNGNVASAIWALWQEREQMRAELVALYLECRASPPHGYLTCQTRYNALEARIAALETRIESLIKLGVLLAREDLGE